MGNIERSVAPYEKMFGEINLVTFKYSVLDTEFLSH